jgi:hypothetical protein
MTARLGVGGVGTLLDKERNHMDLLSLWLPIHLSVALPRTAEFAKVFRVVGTAGILAYSFAFIPNAISFGAYKRTIVAGIIEGIVFGVITGAFFAWRWPH